MKKSTCLVLLTLIFSTSYSMAETQTLDNNKNLSELEKNVIANRKIDLLKYKNENLKKNNELFQLEIKKQTEEVTKLKAKIKSSKNWTLYISILLIICSLTLTNQIFKNKG